MSEKQKLEKVLWSISNDLRGNMDATKFKDYILGLIFFRFLSHNIEDTIKDFEKGKTIVEIYNEYPADVKEECIEQIGYFIEPTQLFANYVEKYNNNELIIVELAKTLNAIESSTYGKESQGDFEGLFSDLNLSSQDLGIDATARNKTIGEIMVKLSEVDFDFNNEESDVLGDAYEYMISMFASTAGKKAGEFYTPQSAAKILTKIISADKTNIKSVYDPTCGSGSLLLRVARDFDINTVNIYGEELNTSTYNLARMNMLIHKVKYDRFVIKNTNTLESPKLMDMRFDAVIANPPFSANWTAEAKFSDDPRFKGYGKLAPKGKADFAFVQHMLYQINDEGTVATVLPHGPLFRGAAEKQIREKLINDNNIDAIIGLPANLFFGTGIPTIIIVLKKCKKDKDILFIDASKEFEKVKTQNILTDEHINKIITTYKNRDEIEKYSHKASLEEIIENDYNLNIPRYVDTFEEEEPIDIIAVSKEYKELVAEEKQLRQDILKQMEELEGDEDILNALREMIKE
ncbi:type I restriction-modification system subunit M [Mollicutes bacterium LVI A0039]|nr:type I restriction-modification system subunit M [Mollicutes bacterium LVI A0039]